MKATDARGSWALVTGASSGIGLEFARQLAAWGMNLVLVVRRQPLLRDLAAQLEQSQGIKTLVLPCDLARPGAASEVKARLDQAGVKVRLLCNNAATGRWGRFESAPVEVYEEMVRLNARSMVALCRVLLDDLASHPKSVIINVSSQAAYQPVPFMAVYAASKAFVQSFSQALYGEWKERGVLVQTLVPGPTATEFDAKAGAYGSAAGKRGTAEEVVKASLAHLEGDQPVVSSVGGTYKQRLFAAIAPPKTVIKTVAKMFRPPDDGGP